MIISSYKGENSRIFNKHLQFRNIRGANSEIIQTKMSNRKSSNQKRTYVQSSNQKRTYVQSSMCQQITWNGNNFSDSDSSDDSDDEIIFASYSEESRIDVDVIFDDDDEEDDDEESDEDDDEEEESDEDDDDDITFIDDDDGVEFIDDAIDEIVEGMNILDEMDIDDDDDDDDDIDFTGTNKNSVYISYSYEQTSYKHISKNSMKYEGKIPQSVREAERKWNSFYSKQPRSFKKPTKVSFFEEETIIELDDIDEDRTSQWRTFAADRERFNKRIEQSSELLSWVFDSVHRSKVSSRW